MAECPAHGPQQGDRVGKGGGLGSLKFIRKCVQREARNMVGDPIDRAAPRTRPQQNKNSVMTRCFLAARRKQRSELWLVSTKDMDSPWAHEHRPSALQFCRTKIGQLGCTRETRHAWRWKAG